MAHFLVSILYQKLGERIKEVVTSKLFLEIYFGHSVLEKFNKREAQIIADRLHAAGIETTVHGPFRDLFPGSYYYKVRDITRERFYETLEAAQIFKPKCVVFHSGYYERYKNHKQEWLENSLKIWEPIVKKAEKIGTIVAVENEYDEAPETLLSLLEKIGSPHFKVCLDVGHINVFAEASMEQWVSTLGTYIAAVHLHDNKTVRDTHIPIGEGDIDFSELVRLLRQYVQHEPLYVLEPARDEDLEANILGFKRFFNDTG